MTSLTVMPSTSGYSFVARNFLLLISWEIAHSTVFDLERRMMHRIDAIPPPPSSSAYHTVSQVIRLQ